DNSAHGSAVLLFRLLVVGGAPARGPAILDGGRTPLERERVARNVLGDDGAGGDIGAGAHREGRDQARVRADERAVLDHGRVLAIAVVVGGDHAGADVHVLTDGGVTEIRDVMHLRL